eukprot:m.484102 g.484102  ORF g.484102 m.484102 type:complete len:96 (-) comp23202_c0_seq1:87-374(-)
MVGSASSWCCNRRDQQLATSRGAQGSKPIKQAIRGAIVQDQIQDVTQSLSRSPLRVQVPASQFLFSWRGQLRLLVAFAGVFFFCCLFLFVCLFGK